MFHPLSNKECFIKVFLVISTVTVVLAEPMEIVSQNEQSQPFIFIERMKAAPGRALEAQVNPNFSRLYVMWPKLLIRVTSEWQQSVLAKSFGIAKVPNEQEMAHYNYERHNLRNMAAEVAMENRIINVVVTLMQILLALDIAILVVFIIMLLSYFCKTKKPKQEVDVVKA
nr:uncharacterized protein LOC106624261 [Bactrocera oleae]